MDLLKRIRQKIDEFCFNHMRMDGAQHLIAGILIYDVLKYLIPVWSAILITLIILVAKEVVLDKWVKKAIFWRDCSRIFSFSVRSIFRRFLTRKKLITQAMRLKNKRM